MEVPSQAILNEQIRQQQLMLYMDSVLLDFDNDDELLKLKSKLRAAQLYISEKPKKQ